MKGEGTPKAPHYFPSIAAMASTRLRTLSWVMGEYPCTVAFVSYTVTWVPWSRSRWA